MALKEGILGKPKRLKVVQINLHHLSAPSIDLLRFMDKEGVDVALIQELWIVGELVCGFLPHTMSMGDGKGDGHGEQGYH